jgi:hypothetical protein
MRPSLGTLQHALRDATATMPPIKIHAPKLSAIIAAAFDPEHADDLATCFRRPRRRYAWFLRRCSAAGSSAHRSAHLGRSELPIDADEEVDNLRVVGVLVSANDSGLVECSHDVGRCLQSRNIELLVAIKKPSSKMISLPRFFTTTR